MPEIVPSAEQMTMLVGKPLYEIWTQLCALIDENYDMERLWGSGGKQPKPYNAKWQDICMIKELFPVKHRLSQ